MKKNLVLFCIFTVISFFSANQLFAQVVMSIPGIKGESRIASHNGWIDGESISFGVSRKVSTTSKAGTSDINIGVGEFSEITISRRFDMASLNLFKFNISGNSPGSATIHVMKSQGGMPYAFLEILLDRPFISSYQMSGSGEEVMENVSLRFNKIKLRYLDSRGNEISKAGWDLATNRLWD